MTATSVTSIDNRSPHMPPMIWLSALVLVVGGGIAAAATHWAVALLPAVLVVIILVMLWPRAGMYILATVMYIRISLPGMYGKYPADVISIVLIAGVLLSRFVNGRPILQKSRINWILYAILAAFAITIFVAYDTPGAIINWLRHAQLFLLTLVLITCMDRSTATAMLRWFLFMTGLVCAVNVGYFLMVGGTERVFGITGPFFAVFTVLAAVHAAVGFLFSRSPRMAVIWGGLFLLYFGGLIATQTRAALIQAVLGLMLLVATCWVWSIFRRCDWLRRRVGVLIVIVVLLVVIILSGLIPILEMPATRIYRALEGREATVSYRLFLWRTGLEAFAGSPIFGIGLAQVSEWHDFIGAWRLDPLSVYTKGLGAHNDFITYLAGTGLAGTIPLFVLFWVLISSGVGWIRRARLPDELQATLDSWIPVATLIVGYFFSTDLFYSLSGMMTSFYFAFWIIHSESPGAVPQRT